MTRERIAELRLKQQDLKAFADQSDPPLVSFAGDQDSVGIKGNEEGLIRLALELLEVASGGTFNPSACLWIRNTYLPLDAIVLESNPEWEEPKMGFWNALGAYCFVGMLVGCLVVGAIVSLKWVSGQFRHLFHI